MKHLILSLFGIFTFIGYSQNTNCNIKITGKIKDSHSNNFIPFVRYEFNNQLNYTDSLGVFIIPNACRGENQITVFHNENEKPEIYHFNFQNDTTLFLKIETCFHEVGEIKIEGHTIRSQEVESLQKSILTSADLDKLRGSSLGESLKKIVGVNSVQTGPSISKPMIHGLYGNRVLILNNGIRLEGQNWGSDHAPEIDPFIASKLSVIKGASSIRYGLEAVAGVVLVETKEMPKSKGINGELNLVGMSNGQAGALSSYIEGAFGPKLKGLSWRLQGTTRQNGSYKTPTYYLTNTASNESNYSSIIDYTSKKFKTNLYCSSFNSEIGIYAGANIETLNDLIQLFESKKPTIKSEFTRKVNRGYQEIHHRLLKSKSEYNSSRLGRFIYTLSFQENRRSEFEGGIPDSLASSSPDAFFHLNTLVSELVWEHKTIHHFSGCVGTNVMKQQNTFSGLEETALIPNYANLNGGIFWLEKLHIKNIILEGGIRYDLKQMKRYFTSTSNYQLFEWRNPSASLGVIYQFNKTTNLHFAYGLGWRPPSPIEMYAFGIHQSAASFEIGDSTLNAEKSNNFQFYFNHSSEKMVFELGGYYNQMNHFIYLNPSKKVEMTEFGAFPVFNYKQANVFFTGVDASIKYNISTFLELNSKTSFIYAYNQTINDYLINIPANRFDNSIQFNKDKIGRMNQCYFQIGTLFVSKQKNTPKNADYVDSPSAYFLINLETGFGFKIKNQRVKISITVNNLTNTIYRDYLNRFRYYSNEIGRNFTVRLKIPINQQPQPNT